MREERPRLRPLKVVPAELALRIPITVGPTGAVIHEQEPTSGLVPLRLGPGPAVDTFQVKWSYFFDL
jgi:hypothetical protein